jgi:hypothetical protein
MIMEEVELVEVISFIINLNLFIILIIILIIIEVIEVIFKSMVFLILEHCIDILLNFNFHLCKYRKTLVKELF